MGSQVRTLFRHLLPNRAASPPPFDGRERLRSDTWPAAIYAIGDIHGCLDQLQQLEQLILADAKDEAGEIWLVYLGDYVDRGPNSAGVIDWLLAAPPPGTRRICLAGNHEELMQAFCHNRDRDSYWLKLGATATLQSYGIDFNDFAFAALSAKLGAVHDHVPASHLAFIENLPICLSVPGVLFVHAGIQPGIPLDQQTDETLQWMRYDPAAEMAETDPLVVHGHTPTTEPLVTPARICIDTGACFSGVLTAVRLAQGQPPRLLSTAP